jgi:hypothetical protein
MPPHPPDLNAVLRDAAVALAALYPGCRNLRLTGETFDGQPLTLPVPAGVFVQHGAAMELPPRPLAEPDPERDIRTEIVDVLTDAGKLLTAKEIADEVGQENDAQFRALLSALVKSKTIENHRPGYGVSSPADV